MTTAMKKIKPETLKRSFWNWFFWNGCSQQAESMLGMAFGQSMAPVIDELYDSKEDKAAGLKRHNANSKFVIPEIYDLGITEKPSPCGNPLRIYNVERTLCDILKGKSAYDIQLVTPAMKAYAVSREKDVAKLLEYAELLRVKPRILRYMEVLL